MDILLADDAEDEATATQHAEHFMIKENQE
jgi:hypothetical protein